MSNSPEAGSSVNAGASQDAVSLEAPCWVNGKPSQSLSVYDRGLAYGDGLFETIRLSHGRMPLLAFHIARLDDGCRRLKIPFWPGAFKQALFDFVDTLGPQHQQAGIVKAIITRGIGATGYTPPPPSQPPTVCIQWRPLPTLGDPKGIALQTSSVQLPDFPMLAGLKRLSCVEYVMAAQAAAANVEPMILGADRRVVETLGNNIFAVIDGQLTTPTLDRCGVSGVWRQWMLDHAASREVAEADITTEALHNASEVFVANSVRGPRWVASLDDKPLWSPGPVYTAWREAYLSWFNATAS